MATGKLTVSVCEKVPVYVVFPFAALAAALRTKDVLGAMVALDVLIDRIGEFLPSLTLEGVGLHLRYVT
jgi:hypothetical protein